MDKRKNIAVIGAGLGGLSAAIYLSAYGFSVDVYEMNGSPGGKADQISEKGFRFDAGPSLLTMPFVLEDLFKTAGAEISNINLHRLGLSCKYFYPDGTVINAYADPLKFADEIERKTADKSESVKSFFSYARTIYNLTARLFLFESFSEAGTFFNRDALKTLLNIRKLDTTRTIHQALSSFFKDERTIQLFDRYATYNGSNPYKAPATLNIISHVEHNLGAYLPEGGIYAVTDALYKLAVSKGVNFYFGTKVEDIIIVERRVSGIMFNSDGLTRKMTYDAVVSNADVRTTYKQMLKKENSRSYKKYIKHEPSSSALVFYWGVKGNYPHLETHNIIFSDDYKTEFEKLFSERKYYDDPTIYIYISSKLNRSDAPAGCENWFVMINAPADSKINSDSVINLMRDIIMRKIKNTLAVDLNEIILFEKIMTPADIETKTGSSFGSLYGISSNSKYAAFRRQSNRSKEFKGLYFCGGSAHPGGGIPLVMLSGKIAAGLLRKYEAGQND